MADRRQEALARGFRSLGAFPLRIEGEVVGCLVLYSDAVGFTLEDELRILDEMAGDVSFILEALGREANRTRLEEQRKLTTELLAALNEPGRLDRAMERVVSSVRAYTGLEAVGVRLRSGEDFRYAEDETDVLTLLRQLFELAGCELATAATTGEAI